MIGTIAARELRSLFFSPLAWTVLAVTAKWKYWSRTARTVLARQVLFTGYEAVKFVSLVAFLIGISIVVQSQVLLGNFGQTNLLGAVLVTVVIREVGPLLTNFIVIESQSARVGFKRFCISNVFTIL